MPKGLVVVKFLVWRRHNAVALVTVTLTFLTFIVLFRNDWLHSYNAVSAVFWLPLLWLGGVVSALATVRVHRRDGAERYAVSAASPRHGTGMRLMGSLIDVIVLAVVPFLANAVVVFGAAKLADARGYLDLSLTYYTVLYLVLLVLLGTLVARLMSQKLIAPLVSFVIALYGGMYIIAAPGEIDTWSIFDPQAYVSLALMLTAATAGVVLSSRFVGTEDRTAAVKSSAAVVLVGILVLIAVTGSYDPTSAVRSGTVADRMCRQVGVDEFCVWTSDEYRLDSLAAQTARARALSVDLGDELPAFSYAQPGLPTADLHGKPEKIATFGASHPSWPAAQFITASHANNWACGLASPPAGHEEVHMLLFDLATNYVYGDIDYSGFSSDSLEIDQERARIGQHMANLSEEEQRASLVHALRSYVTTCELDVEAFTTS